MGSLTPDQTTELRVEATGTFARAVAVKKIREIHGQFVVLGNGIELPAKSGIWQFPIHLKRQEEGDEVGSAGVIWVNGSNGEILQCTSPVQLQDNQSRLLQKAGPIRGYLAHLLGKQGVVG